MAENSPCSERMAARSASREPASMRSAMASACARSSLSLRKARWVNSPARAELHGARDQRVDHHRPAVAVQLQDVLAGVGMRRGKEQRQARVDRLVLRVQKARKGHVAALGEL